MRARTHFVLMARVGGVLGGLLFSCGISGAADWPQYRGPNRNGISTESVGSWPPTQLWSETVGEGFSAVAVAGGRVYTMGWVSGQNTVYCFNADTGAENWARSYSCGNGDSGYRGTRATPTVDGGKVYTFSQDGHLHCWDAATGSPDWNVTPSSGRPGYGFASSPLILGDLVIVNAGGSSGAAFSKNSGDKVWPASFSGTAGHASPVVFTWNSQETIAIFAMNKLVGVDSADGRQLWWYPWTGTSTNASDPIFSGDHIWISTGYGQGCALLQLGTDTDGTGRLAEAWKTMVLGNKENCSVLWNGHLYGINDGGQLKCVEYSTGTEKWAHSGFGTEGSVTLAGGDLIVMSNATRELVIVEATPTAYNERHRASTGLTGRCYTVPVLSNGKIYCRSNQSPGTLVCFNVSGGGPSAPAVTTNDATNVAVTTATLNGNVTWTGGENPTVKIYWGTTDGGTTASNWASVEDLGAKGTGAFSRDVTALAAGITYYFCCHAQNSAGGTWAASGKSFTTLASIQKPGVTTKAASSVAATSARLNGEVTWTGGENPTVKIYWGDNDGGTGTWDNEENLGAKGPGTFFKDVTDLTEGTTYYFRCFASNSAGDTWASSSLIFTATAPVGGLVGHWEFDDGSGSTATDSSAKGNDGTIQGTATWTTGKVGSGALEFDGSTYVAIPNETDYDLADAVSYSVWIKVGASPVDWFGVITKYDNMNLQRRGAEDYLTWQTTGLSHYQLDGSTSVLDGQWHHIVCTYDGSTKVLYVDNAVDATAAATGSIDTTDTAVEIGRNGRHQDLEFIGVMDDVRIYDYALTAGEVQTLYEMGSGGPQGPTITQHPQNVTVTAGDPAGFTVAATGTGTLSYQWYEDGSQVAGATAATHAISSTTLSQNGHKFHCVVTDSGGSATSSQATLTVNASAVDSDGDGLPDSWEDLYGLDPNSSDTDGDGTLDPNEDPDGDGYTNLQEYQNGTNPNVTDATDAGCAGGGPGAAGSAAALLASLALVRRRSKPYGLRRAQPSRAARIRR